MALISIREKQYELDMQLYWATCYRVDWANFIQGHKTQEKKKKKKHILNDGILEQMPAKATGNNTTFDFDSIIVWNSESHNRNIPLSKNSNRKLMCPNSKVKEIY